MFNILKVSPIHTNISPNNLTFYDAVLEPNIVALIYFVILAISLKYDIIKLNKIVFKLKIRSNIFKNFSYNS